MFNTHMSYSGLAFIGAKISKPTSSWQMVKEGTGHMRTAAAQREQAVTKRSSYANCHVSFSEEFWK